MTKQRKSPATNEANPKNTDRKIITSEPLKSTKGVDLRPFKEGIEAARARIPQMAPDPRQVFMDILIAEGFKNVSHIIPKKFQRYGTADSKRVKTPAWSIYCEIETKDGVIGHASYGNFQEGFTRSWSSYSDHKMSASQRVEYHKQREAMKAQREAEEKQRHSEAAALAFEIWSNAPDASEHEYLTNKGAKTATGLKVADDKRLIIPVAVNNEIVSLQFIAGDGTKRFLTGGRLKGGWFMIEGSGAVVYIAEGYSTAASVHKATGATTYIAFNAGNLYEVAVYVKNEHPESRIIIAGDDDTESAGNAGRTKAEQAASGLGVEAVFPQGFNDFNDMHKELGVEALQNYLCPQNLEPYEEPEQNIQDHITRPAGLMGEIYDYYNAVSGHEQKGWSVQTALAIISIVAGRSYCSNHNNFTSLYFMCVGVTGSGKETVITVIDKVLSACGFGHYIAGSGYTSGAAVYSTLLDRPKHITIIDEIGRYLEASAKNAGQHHQRAANTQIMEAWGRCHGTMRPLVYSTMNLKKEDASALKNRRIHNPALTIVGMTTPETLFSTLNIDAVKDGFANRFCFSISDVKRQKRIHKEALPVPQSIIDGLKKIHDRGPETHLSSEYVAPVELTFTEAACSVSSILEDWCIDMGTMLEPYGMSGLTIRGEEIAKRISMCHALGRNPDTNTIEEEDMIWASEYKKSLLEKTIETLKITISHSPHEAYKKEILADLRKRGSDGITKSEMFKTPPYSKHKARELDEILKALKDGELAIDKTAKTKGRGRPTVRWFALKEN